MPLSHAKSELERRLFKLHNEQGNEDIDDAPKIEAALRELKGITKGLYDEIRPSDFICAGDSDCEDGEQLPGMCCDEGLDGDEPEG